MQATVERTQAVNAECPKCGGSGRIKAFGHIEGGVCFACKGKGRIYGKVKVTPPAPKVATPTVSDAEALKRIATILEVMMETDGWKHFVGTDVEKYVVGNRIALIQETIESAESSRK